MTSDNLIIHWAGWTVKHLTRSSAATPLITLYLLICFFAWIMQQSQLWIGITIVYTVAFVLIFFIAPNRLRSEEYNLEDKRMTLGSKQKELKPADTLKIYQPIKILARGRKK